MSDLHVLNGPEMGRSFPIRNGSNFLGRSLDNDIPLQDKTVSRKHLEIIKRGDKYVIRDLKSRNGTFLSGEYITPGNRVPVEEGTPIAVGVTVICLGKGCKEQMMPFLDSMESALSTEEMNRTLQLHRDRVTQRKLEFLHNVSSTLTENLSIKRILEKILDHIFSLLNRIDRAVFVLTDPETGHIKEIVYRSKKPSDDASTAYCRDVANGVIRSGRPFMVADAQTEKGAFADTLELLKIKSVLCVPLISRSQTLGAIYVDSLKRPYGFRKQDLALLMNLSQRIAPTIDDALFASEIWDVAEALSKET